MQITERILFLERKLNLPDRYSARVLMGYVALDVALELVDTNTVEREDVFELFNLAESLQHAVVFDGEVGRPFGICFFERVLCANSHLSQL